MIFGSPNIFYLYLRSVNIALHGYIFEWHQNREPHNKDILVSEDASNKTTP